MYICHTLLGADWLKALEEGVASLEVGWLWVELHEDQGALVNDREGDRGVGSSSSEDTSV